MPKIYLPCFSLINYFAEGWLNFGLARGGHATEELNAD